MVSNQARQNRCRGSVRWVLLVMTMFALQTQAAGQPVNVFWFVPDMGGVNQMLTTSSLSRRGQSAAPGSICSVAMMHVPKNCPRCEQLLKQCQLENLEVSPPHFEADSVLEHQAADARTGNTAHARVSGFQDALFAPASLRLTSRSERQYRQTGHGDFALFSDATSSGKAYFRVVDECPVGKLALRMEWQGERFGNRARFGLRGIPNTGADLGAYLDTTPYSHNADHAGQNQMEISKEFRLTPGVYVVDWSTSTGSSRPKDARVEIQATFEFARLRCADDGVDTDKDGLPDVWETVGIPVDSGNDQRCVPIEMVFPSGIKPDKDVKDLFVELDYMRGFRPHAGFDYKVKDAFKRQGIDLHVWVDEEIGHVDCVQFGSGAQHKDCVATQRYSDIHAAYSGKLQQDAKRQVTCGITAADLQAARRQVFRYAIAVDRIVTDLPPEAGDLLNTPPLEQPGVALDIVKEALRDQVLVKPKPTGSFPEGRADLDRLGFAVASGTIARKIGQEGLVFEDVPSVVPSIECDGKPVRLSTVPLKSVAVPFMHELGHTLGLWHGGADGVGDKPNYVSVMNYLYGTLAQKQPFYCVLSPGGGAPAWISFPIDYSDFKLNPLDQNSLNETAGVVSAAGSGAKLPDFIMHPISRCVKKVGDNGETEITSVTYTVSAAQAPFIDWDYDKVQDVSPVAANLLPDTTRQKCEDGQLNVPTAGSDPLKTQNDWVVVKESMTCRRYFPGSSCLPLQ